MPIVKVDDVSGKSFDYIVIGGGTSGSALAARLAEDPSLSVLVLEAGQENLNDPKIDMPGQYGQTFGDAKYDWGFSTVKQPHCNDKQLGWSRGKALGGSSSMNFFCWIKPPAADIDAFEKLGNPGWNWENYAKVSRKTETFHLPAKELTDLYPHTYNPDFRGLSGPLHVAIPSHVHTVDKLVQETFVNKGVKAIKDPYGGDISGTWIASATMDPKTWKRSYAATSYLVPNLARPNLNVLTEALVSRVLLADAKDADGNLTATGVEFVVNGETYIAKSNKEVLVSAGAINTPKILELSGIGRRDVLSKIGVDVKLDLPGVGENVQEHVFFGVSFELKSDHATLDKFADPAFAAEQVELFADGKGLFRTGITSFAYVPLAVANPNGAPAFYEKAAAEVEALKAKGLHPGLAEQLDIQLDILRDETQPEFELVAFPAFFTGISKPEPGKSYVSILGMLNHPLSRGTIHATSKDPKEHPAYLEILVEQVKYIRSMIQTEPFKSGVVREVDPGPNVQTDEQMRDYVKNHLSSTWHTVGSCSMLPKEKQGVVDPELKIYGTSNLRVVDLSIVPLHIAAHTQATAYVIGEKAAEFIKAGLKK
ncbi:hypothetical protein NLJ89_g3742 [Agrocybe chaxingu]|uniref:pyranose dehydrogenase (acceptor) n=1 Tax=Agrocybe chaxingu TaxID=84603 RepID=A0A9W8MV74_9AGAR|nr:hypothetical protein NLJ89_g3742 [Agrocybe chaxingu]